MSRPPSERAKIAKYLRLEHKLTYQAIADILGITRQGAHLLVNREIVNKYRYNKRLMERLRKEGNNGTGNLSNGRTSNS